ncbi:MAG: tetratricopeptide repeat protein, partial [Pseudomonadota bacterium]
MAMLNKLEAMLAGGQDNALLRFSLGSEHLKAKQLDQAIEHFRKCLQHDPKYSAAWKLLGQALTDAGQPEEAVKVYEEGLRVAEANGDKQAVKEMGV